MKGLLAEVGQSEGIRRAGVAVAVDEECRWSAMFKGFVVVRGVASYGCHHILLKDRPIVVGIPCVHVKVSGVM